MPTNQYALLLALTTTVWLASSNSVPAADSPDTSPTTPLDIRQSPVYQRINAALDRVAVINTHDHLRPFDEIPGRVATPRGKGMTLAGIWHSSYFPRANPLDAYHSGESFDDWWKRAEHQFDNGRTTSVYRTMLPAFRDLYGIDFDTITPAQAADLDRRIFENYKDSKWTMNVITKRANIELMLIDSYWAPYEFAPEWPFGVAVFNINTLIQGFHSDRCPSARSSPYAWAHKHDLPINTFGEYLSVLDRIFDAASSANAACPKCTLAYARTLRFDKVDKPAAARAFGRSPKDVSPADAKAFEDYIFWRICDLAASHDMPFQIHTGHGRIEDAGSSPLRLVNSIEAHPKTTFILFHGGYPWLSDTAIVALRNSRNVRLDFNWLPNLSYSAAKRGLHEFLDVIPSNHLMWGGDTMVAEGVYGVTRTTRDCVAEVLAERVLSGRVREEHAIRIGRQILRENAIETFPAIRRRLAKSKP